MYGTVEALSPNPTNCNLAVSVLLVLMSQSSTTMSTTVAANTRHLSRIARHEHLPVEILDINPYWNTILLQKNDSMINLLVGNSEDFEYIQNQLQQEEVTQYNASCWLWSGKYGENLLRVQYTTNEISNAKLKHLKGHMDSFSFFIFNFMSRFLFFSKTFLISNLIEHVQNQIFPILIMKKFIL